MKKFLLLSLFMVTNLVFAKTNDLKIFFLPACPHCHHALEFLENDLSKQVPNLNIIKVNLQDNDNNIIEFKKALSKCNYTSGGVPLILIKDKCFQGYSDNVKNDIEKIFISDKKEVKSKKKINLNQILPILLCLSAIFVLKFRKNKDV